MTPQAETEEIPRPATPWIVGLLIFIAVAFLWVALQVARIEDWPRSAVLLFAACWLGLGVLAMSGFIIQIFTRLDHEGVTQISARGFKKLLWKDVAALSEGHQGSLRISNDDTAIIIMPMVYNSADGVHRWVCSRLKQAASLVPSKGNRNGFR